MVDAEDDSDNDDESEYGEEEIKQIPIVKKRAKVEVDDLQELYGDEDEEGLGLDDEVSDDSGDEDVGKRAGMDAEMEDSDEESMDSQVLEREE